jgi:hypothetical protein
MARAECRRPKCAIQKRLNPMNNMPDITNNIRYIFGKTLTDARPEMSKATDIPERRLWEKKKALAAIAE